MTNENYKKCRTCRFCIHHEDSWVCSLEATPTTDDDTCGRYRPGSCENCNHLSFKDKETICDVTGDGTYILSVCSNYDPSGRRSI